MPRMMTKLLAVALFGLTFVANTMAAPPPKTPPKDIDMVICLDVSGSMRGLIESAKIKLWDVVNELAKMKPTPNLRVALYTYGRSDNAKDGYVNKDIDLTTDLDEVYKKLNQNHPSGGTEYCGRVTKRALEDQKWSPTSSALRIIFVCGNEPVDQDPVVLIPIAAKLANEMKVVVNTIYCGEHNHNEAAGWQKFAQIGGGKYANIDMNRAAREVAIATPFDKQIVEQNDKLNKTYVAYGKEGAGKAANQLEQDKNANTAGAAAPGAAANDALLKRSEAKAGALYRNSNWDLVDKIKEDPKFDVKSLKEEELCDEMKKLKPEERADYLKKKGEEREAIRKEIGELSAKRSKHIDEEKKKLPKDAGEKALDEALKVIIRTQATEVGFEPEKK